MFCSNCGQELDIDNKCTNPSCPSKTPSSDDYSNNEFSYEDVTQKEMMDFIGIKNTEYYMEKWTCYQENPKFISWNWPAFFFNWLWLAYRKMYAVAAIFFGVRFVVGFISDTLSTVTMVVCMIVSGLIGNQLYIQHAMKKIKEIKYSIPGRNSEDISRRLTALGGINWIPVIVYLVLVVVLFIIGIVIGIAFVSSFGYYY